MLSLYCKTCLKRPSQKEDQKLVFKTDYRLMQVKSIAECSKREHSAIRSTFNKVHFVFETLVLSNFDWPLIIRTADSEGFRIYEIRLYSQGPNVIPHRQIFHYESSMYFRAYENTLFPLDKILLCF